MAKITTTILQGKVEPAQKQVVKYSSIVGKILFSKIICSTLTAVFLNMEHALMSVWTPSRTFQWIKACLSNKKKGNLNVLEL